jgi:hypothetical protein
MIKDILLMVIPVLLAGITFIISLKKNFLSFLDYPLDFGLSTENCRIFGQNKTFRGLLIMSIFTAIYGYLIFSIIDHRDIQIIPQYLIVGLSYSLGELPNSFIKRRLNIAPGNKSDSSILKVIFTFLDTFDSLILIGIVYYFLFQFPILTIICAVLTGGLLHLFTDQLMQILKLKKKINR